MQFELSKSVLAGFDALAPLTLEALLEGYQNSQACVPLPYAICWSITDLIRKPQIDSG